MPIEIQKVSIDENDKEAFLSGRSVRVYLDGEGSLLMTKKQYEQILRAKKNGKPFIRTKFSKKQLFEMSTGGSFLSNLYKVGKVIYKAGKKGYKYLKEHKDDTTKLLDAVGNLVPMTKPITEQVKSVKKSVGLGVKKAPNAWIQKIKAYQAEHPDMSYKQCMVALKGTGISLPRGSRGSGITIARGSGISSI